MLEEVLRDRGYFQFLTKVYRQRALARGEIIIPREHETLDLLLLTYIWTYDWSSEKLGFK